MNRLTEYGIQKTLTTKDTKITKKSLDGAGLGSMLSCVEGTARCSFDTREVAACAERMHSANSHSPTKPVRAGYLHPYPSFVDFVLFVVKNDVASTTTRLGACRVGASAKTGNRG